MRPFCEIFQNSLIKESIGCYDRMIKKCDKIKGFLERYIPENSLTITCGDGLPSVKESPINQRFQQFWKKNRCVLLFSKSGYEEIDLPRGIKV